MVMRVPLMYPIQVVISPLSVGLTRRVDPDGPSGPLTTGYDEDLREPLDLELVDPIDGSIDQSVVTKYKPQIRIPAQVETPGFEAIQQEFGGDAPLTNMLFVLHNTDLKRLGLLKTGRLPQCVPILKTNDRIDAVEKLGQRGSNAIFFKEKLFIYEIRPRSWGMGPTGQDLHIIFTSNRPAKPVGQ